MHHTSCNSLPTPGSQRRKGSTRPPHSQDQTSTATPPHPLLPACLSHLPGPPEPTQVFPRRVRPAPAAGAGACAGAAAQVPRRSHRHRHPGGGGSGRERVPQELRSRPARRSRYVYSSVGADGVGLYRWKLKSYTATMARFVLRSDFFTQPSYPSRCAIDDSSWTLAPVHAARVWYCYDCCKVHIRPQSYRSTRSYVDYDT